MKIGIACASGSVKGVFVHGVLAAFERIGFKADTYAASSSSAIPAAFASVRELSFLNGTEYWNRASTIYAEVDSDISKAVKAGIRDVLPVLKDKLFAAEASCFAVAASSVVDSQAAELTQGEGARKLGKQLILSTRQKDRSWANRNLACRLFATKATDTKNQLTPDNLADALYATTRMLHAWKDPAWINGEPYIDASYTCMCPAIELAQAGMDVVIAISPENGPLYRDFFQSELLPSAFANTRIHSLQPPHNLTEIGVDYLRATEEGFIAAFDLGDRIGTQFLKTLKA